ncbi:flagellar basal body protein [Jiella sp. M17.18]|uniref:flagellar basal body protein n=1 Tax=Jiella sp. M17.18 TaxID=3234247 RepID=UPI0034DED3E4
MDQTYLFGLASRRASWLSNRQAVVAQNVANIDTPGYTTKDIAPFDDVMQATATRLSGTNSMHLASIAMDDGGAAISDTNAWDVESTKKPVVMEQEMLKAGQISRDYSLDTSVIKAFNRMLLMTVKS